ncbi:uncharacterized protein [Oscarella lobularis]|uniref:uncharacterized protein n=1 Tax=Oscarella lobularis TaxID=121494 RepID=UPI0033140464
MDTVSVRFVLNGFRDAFLLNGKTLQKIDDASVDALRSSSDCSADELSATVNIFFNEEGDRTHEDEMSRSIHRLVDALVNEDFSFTIELIWILSAQSVQKIEDISLGSHLSLLGALMRCIRWHRGSITIVSENQILGDARLGSGLIFWAQSLDALLVSREDFGFVATGNRLWSSGSLSFVEKSDIWKSFLSIPGFSMISMSRIQSGSSLELGRSGQIKILKCLDTTSLPLYVCEDHSIYLCLNDSTNLSSVKKLKDALVASRVCLLGRVQVADDRADETSSSLLAEDWYNYAGDEGETFDDGGDDDEKEMYGPLVVLFPCTSCDIAQFKLYVINPPHLLDSMLINDIPMRASLSMLALDSNSNREDDPIEEEDELYTIPRRSLATELDVDVDSWPEVRWCKNHLTDKNNSSPSHDGMMIIDGKIFSPPPQIAEVHVDESVLEKFLPDGTAADASSFSPIAVQSSRGKDCQLFRKIDAIDLSKLKSLSYREALELSAHGIDYCIDGRSSLSADFQLSRIQSRYVSNETSSTCVQAATPVVQLGKRRAMTCVTPCARKKQGTSETSGTPRTRSTPTRRSPRKRVSTARRKLCSSPSSPSTSTKSQKTDEQILLSTSSTKLKRSERHKQRLLRVVGATLKSKKLRSSHSCFERCSKRLFDICLGYLKDLKTSQNLGEEMKKIAKNNVQQVIEFELGRDLDE